LFLDFKFFGVEKKTLNLGVIQINPSEYYKKRIVSFSYIVTTELQTTVFCVP